MVRHTEQAIIYSPLYIHTFRLFQPHTLIEAEKFNIANTDPSLLATTADKLRYYRYRQALLQRDVAASVGICLPTYRDYERKSHDCYPIEHLQKISEVFNVNIENLLDDYNLFLYRGQGWQIVALRRNMGLSQLEFAKLHGVDSRKVIQWENDKVRILKNTWNKLFETAKHAIG